jgi:hypothetical protein
MMRRRPLVRCQALPYLEAPEAEMQRLSDARQEETCSNQGTNRGDKQN